MKSLLKLGLLGAIMSSGAVSVFANDMYVGGGYHLGTYDESGFSEANPNGLKLELGKYIAENIAVEGNLVIGAGSDEVDVYGEDAEIEIKNAISIFLKGDLPLSAQTNAYGLLGFTQGKLEASLLGESYSDDDSGLSYGLGFEHGFESNVYISAEYIFYLSESDYDYTGLNIGLHKRF